MTERAKIQSGLDQMDFEMVDNGVLELPTSTPATYEFIEPAKYDPEGFGEAIAEHNFTLMTANTKEREDGEFYYYVDVLTDHYKKVHVRVWANTACVFPKEELPDRYEFARIVKAIEASFGELDHYIPERDSRSDSGTITDKQT